MGWPGTVINPAALALTREAWAFAAAVGALRIAASDGVRVRMTHEHWTPAARRLNDIQGIIGELAAVLAFEPMEGAEVSHDLYSVDGPVNDVDLLARIAGQPDLRIEVKGLLWSPNKTLFLVSNHETAKARRADCYLPVLSALGGTHAIVGPLIGVDDVDEWGETQFGYGCPPARSMPLTDFTRTYYGRPWDVVRSKFLNSTFMACTEASLTQAAETAALARDRLRRFLAVADGLPVDHVTKSVTFILLRAAAVLAQQAKAG